MWFREYRDYKIDQPLIKEQISSGQGMVGCEMHEINGWGEEYHQLSNKRKKGIFAILMDALFGGEK
jgi:hypothetical protein